MAYTIIKLTSGTSWTVPLDWNNQDNYIECFGGGAGGSRGGGGGGAWSKRTNLTLTVGSFVTYAVGAGGASNGSGGSTWFNGTSYNDASCAAQNGTIPTGGQASACRGGNGVTILNPSSAYPGFAYSGGNGGTVNAGQYGGGGGGGAAGSFGNGNNGSNAGANIGGNGGAGSGGTANGGGSGGTGGTANTTAGAATVGGNGSSTNNAGGGGGGAYGESTYTFGLAGAAGGEYGGGGGGGSYAAFFPSGNGGAGKQGLIIIGYTPASYKLPSSGAISLNNINQTWYSSGRQISLNDQDVRYLIEGTYTSTTSASYPSTGSIDLGTGYNKPAQSVNSGTYTVPGSYTFYVPVHKILSVNLKGAGGGGGRGYTGQFDGRQCTVLAGGGSGSAGGQSSAFGLIAYGGAGGTNQQGIPGTAGGNNQNTNLGGGAAGGDPLPGQNDGICPGLLGGSGGAGGSLNSTIQYFTAVNSVPWVNGTTVNTATIVVGAGGLGSGGASDNYQGKNGSASIAWL